MTLLYAPLRCTHCGETAWGVFPLNAPWIGIECVECGKPAVEIIGVASPISDEDGLAEGWRASVLGAEWTTLEQTDRVHMQQLFLFGLGAC